MNVTDDISDVNFCILDPYTSCEVRCSGQRLLVKELANWTVRPDLATNKVAVLVATAMIMHGENKYHATAKELSNMIQKKMDQLGVMDFPITVELIFGGIGDE